MKGSCLCGAVSYQTTGNPIAFDADGRLWAVSEAGARHYYDSWRGLVLPFYPLIFAVDPARLE